MFAIPAAFARTQVEVHGDIGVAWLARLPATLAACAQRWELAIEPPFPHLSYHYAAPAVRADGTPVVVKACAPTGEFALEAATLRAYDGRGAARLLASDAAREVLLLERLQPGTLLLDLADDEAATASAAGVMRALWCPVPQGHPFPAVADWGRGFARLRRRYGGGTGPFPTALVERAERLYADLGASAAPPVLLHGDLHHYNILDAGPRGWLAIDPKGIVGEPAYEVGAFLRNRLPGPLPNPEAGDILARRIAIFAAVLGLDGARIRAWGLAQAVLSAWWSMEDHGHGWEPALALAGLLAASPE